MAGVGFLGVSQWSSTASSFISPLLNDDHILHLLPPVGLFSDFVRERTHQQLSDLANRCQKLTTNLGNRHLQPSGAPFLDIHSHDPLNHSKGCSKPPFENWTASPSPG